MKRIKSNRSLYLVFVLVTIILLATGYEYNYVQVKKNRQSAYELVNAVGLQKTALLGRWFDSESRGFTRLLNSNLIAETIIGYTESNTSNANDNLRNYLTTLQTEYDFADVQLIRADQSLIANSNPSNNEISPEILKTINKTKKNQEITIVGLLRMKGMQSTYYGLIIPIKQLKERDLFLVAYIDVLKNIYPIIRFWPTKSKSAESYICRFRNDTVQYLSELKFKDDAALNYKRAIPKSEAKKSIKVDGFDNVYEALDYRKEPVVCFFGNIPGTDWTLITKIDQTEVDQAHINVRIYRFITLFLIWIFLFSIIYFFNLRRQKRLYFELFNQERNLIAFRKQFEGIINSLDEGLILTDQDGKILYLNKAGSKLLGLKEDEVIFSSFSEFYRTRHPKTADEIIRLLESKPREYPLSLEPTYTILDSPLGKSIPIVEQISYLLNEEDQSKKIVITFKDDTIKRELDNKIAENEIWQRTLTKSLPDGLIVVNQQGIIHDINDQTLTLFGYNEDELIGENLNKLIPQRYHGHHFENIQNYIQQPRTRPMGSGLDLFATRKNGTEFPVDISLSPIYNNQELFVLCLVRDITVSKRAQWALKEALKKAEESDKLKSYFLQNMFHEIRTPLNGIQGFITLLADHDISKLEQQEYIEQISHSAERLLTTMTDIIEISKIEAADNSLNIESVNLNLLFQQFYNQYLLKAQAKGITLKVSHDSSQDDLLINTDKRKLTIALDNLLSNAIKFTDQGYIFFGFEKNENELIIFIEDSGPGIPEEEQLIIFGKFTQIDNGYTRKYEGNGLGLAVVKAISEQLHARIWLSSIPGKGTTFYMSLPFTLENPFNKVENTQ